VRGPGGFAQAVSMNHPGCRAVWAGLWLVLFSHQVLCPEGDLQFCEQPWVLGLQGHKIGVKLAVHGGRCRGKLFQGHGRRPVLIEHLVSNVHDTLAVILVSICRDEHHCCHSRECHGH
jgi:hypothetical protein